MLPLMHKAGLLANPAVEQWNHGPPSDRHLRHINLWVYMPQLHAGAGPLSSVGRPPFLW